LFALNIKYLVKLEFFFLVNLEHSKFSPGTGNYKPSVYWQKQQNNLQKKGGPKKDKQNAVYIKLN